MIISPKLFSCLFLVSLATLIFMMPAQAAQNVGTTTGYIDLGNNAQYVNSFSWTFNAGTSTANTASSTLTVYGCSTTTPGIAYSGCAASSPFTVTNASATTTATSSSLSGIEGFRYLHYSIVLRSTTNDPDVVPFLTSVRTSYDFFRNSGWLMSSPFDSESVDNLLASIIWASSSPAGTSMHFQIRTASDNAGPNWSNPAESSGWCGPNVCSGTRGDADYVASSSSFYTPGMATTSLRDGLYDQWMQYVVWLETADTSKAPILTSFTMQYAQNAPPQVQSVVAVQATSGVVSIDYQVRDPDTASSSPVDNVGKMMMDLQFCATTTNVAINCPDKGATAYWQTASTSLLIGEGEKLIDPTGVLMVTGSLIWSPANEEVKLDNQTLKLRVRANDREFANSFGYGTTTIDNFDNKPPVPINLEINAGDGQFARMTIDASDGSDKEMRLAFNQADFADANFGWKAYSTTDQLQILTAPAVVTVYAQYRDIKSNISDIGSFVNGSTTVTTPKKPTQFMITDLSNFKDEANIIYALEFSWARISDIGNGSVLNSFNIYSDVNQSGLFTNLVWAGSVNSWRETTDSPPPLGYELRPGMPKMTPVYYVVNVTDLEGNVSMPSTILGANANGVPDLNEGGGGNKALVEVPQISSSSVVNIFSNNATVIWDTDIRSDSQIIYTEEAGCKFDTPQAKIVGNALYAATTSGAFGGHSITIPGLAASTTYFYQIRSTNANGAGLHPAPCSTSTQLSFTTKPGPNIIHDSIVMSSSTNTTIDIRWDTDLSTDNNFVFYSTSTEVLDLNSLANPAPNIGVNFRASAHGVTLFGLVPGTPYRFFLQSDNAVDFNADVTGKKNYFFFATTYDLTPPEIKGVNVSVSDLSASISFTTTEMSTSTIILTDPTTHIEVARETYVGQNSNGDVYHPITFNGLASSTSYDYAIVAYDMNGNGTAANGTIGNFTTLATPDTIAPVISTSSADLVTGVSATAATINWHTPGELSFGYLDYLVGTTTDFASSSQPRTTSLNVAHSVTLSNLIEGETYYFRLRARDGVGNESSSPATSTNGFYQFTTIAGPIISSTTATSTETSATITWTTSESANGYVIYGTPDLTNSTEKGSVLMSTDHSVTITGINPATTYQYKLRSTNANTGVTIYPTSGTLNFTTGLSAFTISNVATSAITDRSAVVTWTTSRQTKTKLYYGTTQGALDQLKTDENYATNPTMVITGLASSTTYYFQIVNTDDLNRIATSSEYSFTTTNKLYDESVVNQLQSELASTTARLNALNGAISKAEADALSAEIARLTTELTKAKQSAGGGGVVVIDKTDKVAPIISQVGVSEINADSVMVNWLTNEPASSFISYGTSSVNPDFKGLPDMFTKHFFRLFNLKPSTTYHYTVQSADAQGNLAKSEEFNFTTRAMTPEEALIASTTEIAKLDEETVQSAADKIMKLLESFSQVVSLNTFEGTLLKQFNAIENLAKIIPAPVLSGEPLVITTPTTASVAWHTDKPSNSQIGYVENSLFAGSRGKDAYSQVVGNSDENVIDHGVKIFGLKPDTTYNYQLRSRASLGPAAFSKNFMFKTKPEGLEVVNYSVDIVSPERAIFRWLTSSPTNSQVTITPYRDTTLAVTEAKTIMDKSYVANHEMVVSDLIGGVIYQISLAGVTEKGLKVEKVISRFSTTKDDLPPDIMQIQTESAMSQGKNMKVQSVITWFTNEPTVCYVKYAEGAVTDEVLLTETTPTETGYGRKHTNVITKFESGKIYSYRVYCEDSGANKAMSSAHTILTPRQNESVFDLIIKTLEETFGWVGKMR